MSRPLVFAALLVFALLALGPVAAMLPRIEGSDVASVFEARIWTLFGRTFLLGLGTAALAFALGLPFGVLVARADLPGAAALRTLGVVPLLLPPLFLAMTWTVFTDWRGYGGAIWILGLGTFPLVAIFAARAAERIDGRLEDAARLAGGWRAVVRTDLGLIVPPALAGACLAFVFAVNDFAVPDYVSTVGPKFNVYADEIFASWVQIERPGMAVAKSMPLVLINLLALVPALALRRMGAMASLGSGFQSPRPWSLGAFRWVALAFVLGVLSLSVVLPLGRLLHESGGGPVRWSERGVAQVLGESGQSGQSEESEASGEAAAIGFGERLRAAPAILPYQARQTGAAFDLAFERSRGDIARSLRHSALAALLAVALGLVLGHAVERTRRRWLGRCLELVALIPLAVPATLFGIGAIVLWTQPALQPLYASDWLPSLLFAGRLGGFAVLILSGAVASLDRSLEDAGALARVGPARRLVRIVAPSLVGSLVGSWTLVFAFAMRELDLGILVPAASQTAIVRIFNGVHFGRDDFVAALALVLVLAVLLPGLLWSAFARRRLEVLP